ncbi:MAG TPA: PQQ-dependent sugar dehydrogenase [Actinomycetota bacterium]
MVRRLSPLLVLVLLLPAPARAQEGFERVVDGLDFAVNVAIAPDGAMFVADKDLGQIRVVRDGELLTEPFASVDVAPRVNEMGLLGVALHPRFPDEPWVYAYYSDASDGRNRLVRFRAEGDVAAERQDLMDLLPTVNGWHNGGDMTFGPDGKLYLSVGEGHEPERAQEPAALGGRILRLDPDGSVPSDNPFGPDNPTFALGFRNSFGVCFDVDTGGLWVTDNGPSAWDEINRVEAGGNHGWPLHLGPGGPSGLVEPILAFEEIVVPTGCAGSATGEGLYVGEGYTGRLHRMRVSGGSPSDEVVATFEGGITALELDADGRLVLVTPTTIHRSLEVVSTPSPSTASPSGTEATPTPSSATVRPTPSPSPAVDGPFGALGTGVGILVAALLFGLLLWLRGRVGR